MIRIQDDVKIGDRVYLSYSIPGMQTSKTGKKPEEYEYVVESRTDEYIRFMSQNGYTVMFTKELLTNWDGNCRKV